jgi:hypothetical protein
VRPKPGSNRPAGCLQHMAWQFSMSKSKLGQAASGCSADNQAHSCLGPRLRMWKACSHCGRKAGFKYTLGAPHQVNCTCSADSASRLRPGLKTAAVTARGTMPVASATVADCSSGSLTKPQGHIHLCCSSDAVAGALLVR